VGSALLEEVGHFLQLAPSCADIVKQVTQLARIRLDADIVLLELWIALQHQHLVFRATGLACGVHGQGVELFETHGGGSGSRKSERLGYGGKQYERIRRCGKEDRISRILTMACDSRALHRLGMVGGERMSLCCIG